MCFENTVENTQSGIGTNLEAAFDLAKALFAVSNSSVGLIEVQRRDNGGLRCHNGNLSCIERNKRILQLLSILNSRKHQSII